MKINTTADCGSWSRMCSEYTAYAKLSGIWIMLLLKWLCILDARLTFSGAGRLHITLHRHQMLEQTPCPVSGLTTPCQIFSSLIHTAVDGLCHQPLPRRLLIVALDGTSFWFFQQLSFPF